MSGDLPANADAPPEIAQADQLERVVSALERIAKALEDLAYVEAGGELEELPAPDVNPDRTLDS